MGNRHITDELADRFFKEMMSEKKMTFWSIQTVIDKLQERYKEYIEKSNIQGLERKI